MNQEFQEIKCSSCGLPLYRVLGKATEERFYILKAKCPNEKCQDKAFDIRVQGKIVFASSDYCHAKPRPEYKERTDISMPLEYTDIINVECQQFKPFKRK